MDEEEYDQYLNAVFGMDYMEERGDLCQQLRDDDGYRVPGCYRVMPAPDAG